MNEMVKGNTTVYGLIGYPVGHSFSPQLHNTLNQKLGRNAVYIPFPVTREELGNAVKGLKALNVAGFNVTVPYKKDVMPFLDFISPEAQLIGAVNTVKLKDGKLNGYNTDGDGFVRAFEENFGDSPKGKKVVMLGAGGSARSIAIKLAMGGVGSLFIANRTFSKAEELADLVNKHVRPVARPVTMTPDVLAECCKDTDVIINTTSIGMFPKTDESPVESNEVFSNKPIVCDIIANPGRTRFLRTAENAGCKVMNGVGMLYFQGIYAYEIWMGEKLDLKLVKECYDEFKKYNQIHTEGR